MMNRHCLPAYYKVPDDTLFTKTPACKRDTLNRLLENDTGIDGLAGFRTDLLNLMKKSSPPDSANNNDFYEYNAILNHCENIAFLRFYGASFIKTQPLKLQDTDYCREWVLGIRLDFSTENDTEKAADLIMKLTKVGARLKNVFPGIMNETSGRERPSEAVVLTAALNHIKRQPLSINHSRLKSNRDKKSDSQKDEFEDSFNERFIMIESFKNALGVSYKTVTRYINDNDIRVLELSSNTRYLYREDVEAFLRDKTKE